MNIQPYLNQDEFDISFPVTSYRILAALLRVAGFQILRFIHSAVGPFYVTFGITSNVFYCNMTHINCPSSLKYIKGSKVHIVQKKLTESIKQTHTRESF